MHKQKSRFGGEWSEMKMAGVSCGGLSAEEFGCFSIGMRVCSGSQCHGQLSSENQLVHLEDILERNRVTGRRPVKKYI